MVHHANPLIKFAYPNRGTACNRIRSPSARHCFMARIIPLADARPAATATGIDRRRHFLREAAYGPHEASVAVQGSLDQARADAARLLNAAPAEIAFTSSGSAGTIRQTLL